MNNYLRIIAYLLPALALIYVYIYGVNVVFMDEFEFVNLFNDKVDFWKFILRPHNEHFMPLGKLEYYSIAKLTSMNSKVLMFVNVILLWIPYLCFIRKIKTKNKFVAICGIFFFYLAFFSPLGFENFLWGFQIAFLSAYAFGILSILYCDYYLDSRKNRYLVLSSLFCIIASLNSSHGIISWVSILMVLMYSKEIKKCLFALTPCILIIMYYKLEMSEVAAFQSSKLISDLSLIKMLRYFLTFISSDIWAFNAKNAWMFGFTVVLGTSLLIFSRKNRENYLFVTLTVFGIFIAAIVTFGRWKGAEIEWSLASRYFHLQMPIYLALASYCISQPTLYLMDKKFKFMVAYLLFIFTILLLFMSYNSINSSKDCYDHRMNAASVLKSFPEQPQDFIPWDLYPNYGYVKEKYQILKSKKLNVFSNDSKQ